MRAGHLTVPKMSHQILAPVLAQRAEPKRLQAPPTPGTACAWFKQNSYPGPLPRKPKPQKSLRLSWGQREHET